MNQLSSKRGTVMKNQSYWKVILRYGHVGHHKSIEVARYLAFDEGVDLAEVCSFASLMPGVKSARSVSYAKKVDYSEYCLGKEQEESNFFLQQLKTFKRRSYNVA